VLDGQDSDRAGDELTFNLRLAIAQDYLNPVKANYQAAVNRKVDQRAHIYKSPFGYRKEEEGRLVIDDREAALVREVFERRAAGADIGTLTRFLSGTGAVSAHTGKALTKSGVRKMLTNRTYVGEIRVQSGKRGEPRVIADYHAPIVTPALFEAANATKGAYHERDGTLTKQAMLRGLCYCGTCGKRLRIAGYTAGGERVAVYGCTYPDCAARASIRASKLDNWILYCVQQAAIDGDPFVAAVIEGGTAFQDALEAVAAAQAVHDELRDDVGAQKQLGMKNWLAALRVRQDQIELARAQLRAVRPVAKPREARDLQELEKATLAQFISKVIGRSSGRVADAARAATGTASRPARAGLALRPLLQGQVVVFREATADLAGRFNAQFQIFPGVVLGVVRSRLARARLGALLVAHSALLTLWDATSLLPQQCASQGVRGRRLGMWCLARLP